MWGQSKTQLQGRKFPGYVGWVPKRALGERAAATHQIVSLSAPVFSQDNIKSPVKICLPLGAAFSALQRQSSDDFIEIDEGFLHAAHVKSLGEKSKETDWVTIAEGLMGRPYIWGGVSSFGLDCSGLVQTALRTIGKDAPRDSDQQMSLGQEVTDGALRRGDLVFWKGHVGIMQSETQLIHANAYHMMVASEALDVAKSRI